MKKKSIIIYQTICLIFLILYIIGINIKNKDLYFIFLGYYTNDILIIIFLVFELVFFIITKLRKIVKILSIITCSFLILISIFGIIISPKYVKTMNVNKDYEVVISSSNYFISGWSTIYNKKNSFIMKKVDTLYGDEGYMPLNDDSTYTIIYYDSGFEIDFFNGNEDESAYYLCQDNEITICDKDDLK